mmetsp:Transcript_57899/g.123102  ORF Transcript_57899/g.123102 Transcript_57899/m.123102 type:complete len:198 (-) Transcript_57899:99-692(-)
MCNRTIPGFYQWGGFVAFFMCFTAILIYTNCPYKAECAAASYFLIATAVISVLQCLLMISIGRAMSKVDKIDVYDLAPTNITASLKWKGTLAKRCPYMSRVLLLTNGSTCMIGLAVAASMCPTSGNWESECSTHSANSMTDFGVILALFAMLSAIGCCTNTRAQPVVYLYDPEPEHRDSASEKVGGCVDCIAKCVHP